MRPSRIAHTGPAAGAVLVSAGLLAVLLGACNSGSKTLLQADPGAVPAHPTYAMVHSIVDRACAPCHKSGGAADTTLTGSSRFHEHDLDYATCAGIQDGIQGLIDTGVDRESMPPGAWPRLTEEEKLVILRWVADGACSPCRPCR